MGKRISGISLALLLLVVPARRALATPPGVAGALSIIPGLGQVSNGDVGEGALWFASVVAALSWSSPGVQQAGFDLWQYNMYDAYRDAGARDTAKQSVYSNYLGTFNPLNIIDPIGAPVLGLQGAVVMRPDAKTSDTADRLGLKKVWAVPLVMGFVGLGEEGLFRGFLFPGFSHLTGSKPIGAVISSALFSAVHMTDGTALSRTTGVLAGRFLFGLLFCWQADLNRYDLRKSIFAHAWFDVLAVWDDQGVFPATGPPQVLGFKAGFSF